MARALDQDAFGELRSLLQHEATPRGWRQLCALLEAWPDPEHLRRVALPYARDHLDTWPASLRTAPPRWREALLEGAPPAALSLVGTLFVGTLELQEFPEAIDTLTRSPHLGGLRRLLIQGPLRRTHVEAIARSEALGALAHLHLRRHGAASQAGGDADALAPLTEAHQLDRLRALELEGWRPGDRFVRVLALNASATPLLRRLSFEGAPLTRRSVEALRHAEAWPALASLGFGGARFGHQALARLDEIAREHGWWLGELELRHANLSPRAAELIADGAAFEGLERLGLFGCLAGPAGAQALAEATCARHLRALDLGFGRVGDAGVAALAGSPASTYLEELGLMWCDLSDEGLSHLAASEHMRHLRQLNLSQNQDISARALALLTGAPVALSIQDLRLGGLELGEEGVEAITQGRFLRQLEVLILTGGSLQDIHVEALSVAPRLTGLRTLRLDDNPLTDRAARALARSMHLRRLERLELGRTAIGDEGARAIAGSSALEGLHHLGLGECQIGPEGARALADSAHLTELRALDLRHNPIGLAGAEALAQSEGLVQLESLSLEGPTLADERCVRALLASPHLGPWIKRTLRHAATIQARAWA